MSWHKDRRKNCKGSHSDDLYSSNQIAAPQIFEVNWNLFDDTKRKFRIHKKYIMWKYIPALNPQAMQNFFDWDK